MKAKEIIQMPAMAGQMSLELPKTRDGIQTRGDKAFGLTFVLSEDWNGSKWADQLSETIVLSNGTPTHNIQTNARSVE